MYIVYDPNHHVRLVSQHVTDAFNKLRDMVNEGHLPQSEYTDDHLTVYTVEGVYTIHELELGTWIK